MDAAVARSDLRALSIRPSWVQWEGNYERSLGPWLRDPFGGPPSESFWSYIDVYDLAHALRLAAESSLDGHEAMYVVSPDNATGRPLRELIAHHFGAEVARRRARARGRGRDLQREGRAADRLPPDALVARLPVAGRRAAGRGPRAARPRADRRPAGPRRAQLTLGRRRSACAAARRPWAPRSSPPRAGRGRPRPRRRRPCRASRARAASPSGCRACRGARSAAASRSRRPRRRSAAPRGRSAPAWTRETSDTPGSSGPWASDGITAIGPISGLMPQRPTIWRAIPVSCWMSDSAPAEIEP